MSRRPARFDELKEIFHGVDTGVLWDLDMADIVSYDYFDGGAKIENNVAMFAFIMRRLFPAAKEESDE